MTVYTQVSLSPKSRRVEGGLAPSPGVSTLPTSPQPGPTRCKNTMSPWYTLPHLFSQHACEVGRGRDCPHFTEEEVEAHRGQVTCPRSQTAAKLEWGPRAGPLFTWGPCSECRTRGRLQCHRRLRGREQPSCTGPPPPPARPPTLQAWATAAQGSHHPGSGTGGAGERRMIGVKKKNSEAGQMGPQQGAGGRPKKRPLTHKVYIFTHTCTHT